MRSLAACICAAQSCLAAVSTFKANNWPRSQPFTMHWRPQQQQLKKTRCYRRGQSLARCTSDPGGWCAKIIPLMIYWFPITLIFTGHADGHPPVRLAKKFNLQSGGEAERNGWFCQRQKLCWHRDARGSVVWETRIQIHTIAVLLWTSVGRYLHEPVVKKYMVVRVKNGDKPKYSKRAPEGKTRARFCNEQC